MSEKYMVHTTGDGLRIVTVPRADADTVTMTILCRFGSRYEDKRLRGIAHFMEHMLFKGTENRDNAQKISRELDQVGAVFNAYTSKDHTAYYAKVQKDHIDVAIDVLSDIYLNSLFDQEEINRERGVILEEIKMYHENPLMHIEDLNEQLLFQDSSLGESIAGTKETVSSMNREDFVALHQEYYRPQTTVVAVAGNIPEDTVDRITKAFSFKQSGGGGDYPAHENKQQAARVVADVRQTEQVQLGLSVPTVGLSHEDRYALMVMTVILGGNMSSRLFTEVRERRGLAYVVRATLEQYQDAGSIYVQSGLEKSRLPEAIEAIWEQMLSMQTNVSDEDIAHAQEYLIGQIAISMENSTNMAQWYGTQLLLKDEITAPQDRIDQIRKVTADDVKQVATKYIKANMVNLAAIGPYTDKELTDMLPKD